MSKEMGCVIITGAGSGIGKAIALNLATHGFHIVCISKSAKATVTAQSIRSEGGSAEDLIVNLTDYNHAGNKIRTWISEKNYRFVGIVLAAGVLGPVGPLENTTMDQWNDCLQTNVIGNLAVLKEVLPRLINGQFGRIVWLGGGGAAYAYPIFPAYAASKVAIVRIIENLHEDLKSKGNFSVVCLAPGANDTEMLKKVREAGGEVKTVVEIGEPVNFVSNFILSRSCNFSGCLVHVRDLWAEYLNNDKKIENNQWKLRRIE